MLAHTLAGIKTRIASACRVSGRDEHAITIVAVTKGSPVEKIIEAIEAGITDIGENKIQEALIKYNAIRDTPGAIRIRWHMIGHLQTNKVKDAVRIFDLIHSVDSVHLAQEINAQAAKINKIQDILVEVNTAQETTKYGFSPETVQEAVKAIAPLKNIALQGLMTIAPIVDNPEQARPYFRKLKELFDGINQSSGMGRGLSMLSMGMTDDFGIAIEEGATIIRLGRAIFNPPCQNKQ